MNDSNRNLYDFDKTIYKKDSSLAFLFFCLRKKPYKFLYLFKMLFYSFLFALKIISLDKFKEKYFSFLKWFKNIDEVVEKFWEKESKNINKFYLEQKQDDDVISSASPEFLIKAYFKKINSKALIICTKVDKTNGKFLSKNCKGEEKVNRLNAKGLKQLGAVYTDSVSDFPILDLTQNKFIVCGSKVYRFKKQKPTFSTKIKYAIKQLRIKDYVKNALIVLPLFFGGLVFNGPSLIKMLLGVISFCCASSFVYIINDLIDVDKDRLHKRKRKRPIASYMIKPFEAIVMALILISASILINIFTFGLFSAALWIILAYIVVNILYSVWLKNIVVLDVFILAFCYMIRLFYGGIIISVPISRWLYLTVLCASLFMGFGKRRNEAKQEISGTRKVNKKYSYEFLDKSLYVCLSLTIVFYSLWAIEIKSADAFLLNGKLLLASIPLVVFILLKYCLNIEKKENSGNPVDVLLKDAGLIVACLLFVCLIVLAVYFPIPNWFIN